jgi:hypothetical protein
MRIYEYYHALFRSGAYGEWEAKQSCKGFLLFESILIIALGIFFGFAISLTLAIVIGIIGNLVSIIASDKVPDEWRGWGFWLCIALFIALGGAFGNFGGFLAALLLLLPLVIVAVDFYIIKKTRCAIINRELRQAIAHNNFKRTKSLYRKGFINWDRHVHEPSSFYALTPILNEAIRQADLKIVKLLLTHPGIAIHERPSHSTVGGDRSRGPTPLEMAVQKGCLELVKLLLDHPRMTARHAASAYKIAGSKDIREAFETFFKQRIAVPKKITRGAKKFTVYGDRGRLLFSIPKDRPGDRVKKATIKNSVVIIETEAEKVFEYAYQIFSGDFQWREISPLSSGEIQEKKVMPSTTAEVTVPLQIPVEIDTKAQLLEQKRKKKEGQEQLKTQARVKAAEARRQKLFEQTKTKAKKK